MKNITINTGASWSGTIPSWQDGDKFRETNTDTVSTAIADRLGYLKTLADGAVTIGASPTWLGTHTFGTTNTTTGNVTTANITTANIATANVTTYNVASVALQRCYVPSSTSGDWVFDTTLGWKTASNATSNIAFFDLSSIPHGAVITAIHCYIKPDTHGTLPSGMPHLALQRRNSATGGITGIASQTDGANLAIFNTYHAVSLNPLNHTVDKANYAYQAYLLAESGTNSMDDFAVQDLLVMYTITTLDVA